MQSDTLLRLVAFLHYVSGTLMLLASSFWIAAAFLNAPENAQLSRLMQAGKLGFALAALLLFLVCAAVFFSGEFIYSRVYRKFSIAVSLLLVIFFPLGSIVGIASVLILTSPTTKLLYTLPPPSVPEPY